MIAKPVVGTKHSLLFTQKIAQDELNDESIRSVPAIYQESVPGNVHLRVNCFGEYVTASRIQTDDLDWRSNLNVSIETFNIDNEVTTKIYKTLNALGLAMGIIDLKITPNGEVVWFEVNPQGQFLFLEGITNEPLLKSFCSYLVETAKSAQEKT